MKKTVKFLDAEISTPSRGDVILAITMVSAADGLVSLLQAASGSTYSTAIVVGTVPLRLNRTGRRDA